MSLAFFHFLCSLLDLSIQTNRLSALQRQVRQLRLNVRSDLPQKATVSLPSTPLSPLSGRTRFQFAMSLPVFFHPHAILVCNYHMCSKVFIFHPTPNFMWKLSNRDRRTHLNSHYQSLYVSLTYIQFARSLNSPSETDFWTYIFLILWHYLPFANFNTLLELLCFAA